MKWFLRQTDWIILLLLLLLLWQILANAQQLRPGLIPSPLAVGSVAIDLVADGTLRTNALSSLRRVAIGFLTAGFLGTLSGIILGLFPAVARRVSPLFDILRPIPPIAWIPIAILWFGLGNPSAYFIVFIGAFFPILMNAHAGIVSVSQTPIDAARCLGARRLLLITDVLVPSALPIIMTGLRVGIGIAWTSVIAAEMVGAQSGLGYMIQLNRTMLETEKVVVGMLTIGGIGWCMNWLALQAEHCLTRWNRDTLIAQQKLGYE